MSTEIVLATGMVNITADESDRPTVSGRELHTALEIQTPYKKWFDRMCEYGFTENSDFILVRQNCPTNNPKNPITEIVNHQITIGMAKELCMIQRTEKGRQCRKYFLDIEAKWNNPEAIVARALQISQKKLDRLLHVNIQLEEKIKQDEPKVIFADSVSVSDTSILVGDMAKILKQNGVDTGQNRLFEWLRDNGYLISRAGASFNMPTQKSMEMGLFEIKERTVNCPNRPPRITKTPMITGKGQIYFAKIFLKKERDEDEQH